MIGNMPIIQISIEIGLYDIGAVKGHPALHAQVHTVDASERPHGFLVPGDRVKDHSKVASSENLAAGNDYGESSGIRSRDSYHLKIGHRKCRRHEE